MNSGSPLSLSLCPSHTDGSLGWRCVCVLCGTEQKKRKRANWCPLNRSRVTIKAPNLMNIMMRETWHGGCNCRSQSCFALTIKNRVSAVTALIVPNIYHLFLLEFICSLQFLQNRSHWKTKVLPKLRDLITILLINRDTSTLGMYFSALHLNSSGLVSAHVSTKPLALHFRFLPWVLIIETVSTVAALLIASPSAVGGDEGGRKEACRELSSPPTCSWREGRLPAGGLQLSSLERGPSSFSPW